MALVMVAREIMAAMVPATALVMAEWVPQTVLVMAICLGLHQIQEMVLLMEVALTHQMDQTVRVQVLAKVMVNRHQILAMVILMGVAGSHPETITPYCNKDQDKAGPITVLPFLLYELPIPPTYMLFLHWYNCYDIIKSFAKAS